MKKLFIGLLTLGSLSVIAQTRTPHFWAAYDWSNGRIIELEQYENGSKRLRIELSGDAPDEEISAVVQFLQNYSSKIILEDDKSILPDKVMNP